VLHVLTLGFLSLLSVHIIRNGHVGAQQRQQASVAAAALATDNTINTVGRQTHHFHPHHHTLHASGSSLALRESTLVPWAEASSASSSPATASSRKLLRPRCNTDAGVTRPQRLMVDDFPLPPLPAMPSPSPPLTTTKARSVSSVSAKAPPPSLPPLIIRPPPAVATASSSHQRHPHY
jgi:hypothetical protein